MKFQQWNPDSNGCCMEAIFASSSHGIHTNSNFFKFRSVDNWTKLRTDPISKCLKPTQTNPPKSNKVLVNFGQLRWINIAPEGILVQDHNLCQLELFYVGVTLTSRNALFKYVRHVVSHPINRMFQIFRKRIHRSCRRRSRHTVSFQIHSHA